MRVSSFVNKASTESVSRIVMLEVLLIPSGVVSTITSWVTSKVSESVKVIVTL